MKYALDDISEQFVGHWSGSWYFSMISYYPNSFAKMFGL